MKALGNLIIFAIAIRSKGDDMLNGGWKNILECDISRTVLATYFDFL